MAVVRATAAAVADQATSGTEAAASVEVCDGESAAGAQEWDHLTREEYREYCEMMASYFDGLEAAGR